jgi:hypothetical protein
MQNIMAELRQLGTLDPAAQDQLLENLRASDPSLWPLVVEQFRATMAYRQRAAAATAATVPATPSRPPVVVAPSPVEHVERLPDAGPTRLPVADGVALAPLPAEPPRETTPPAVASPPAAVAPANQPAEKVMQASYTVPVAVAADWRQQLDRTIQTLEAEAAKAPDAGRQRVEAKAALGEAMAKLDQSAPLAVHNLAFCTEIQSYGCMKRFERYQFQPNQEVLLYAEVENFISEPTPKGYHTSLRSNYQVVDARGQRVAEHAFAVTEEYCQNRRRDFFIGYHMRLPKAMEAGRYRLRLAIEDLKGHKTGAASIEFEIRAKETKK